MCNKVLSKGSNGFVILNDHSNRLFLDLIIHSEDPKVREEYKKKKGIMGDILKSDVAEDIVKYLMKNKSEYLQKIANDLNYDASLVLRWLEKMIDVGILEIINKPINKRTKPHRYFKLLDNLSITINV